MASAFLTGEWRKLIMANYLVDPAILQKHLPYKTFADTWNGNTYVSLVGFMFRETKVRGIKIPFHINFPEVNLRFYVKYKDGSVWKRGVVFLKEIVPRPAIVFVANNIYNEKYVSLPMRHQLSETGDSMRVRYEWKFQRIWNSVSVDSALSSIAISNGSEEEYITEHFWGYSKINANTAGEYQVAHPRWEIYPVHKHEIHCDFKALYGDEFAQLNNQQAHSVFLAEGSPITIYKKKIIDDRIGQP